MGYFLCISDNRSFPREYVLLPNVNDSINIPVNENFVLLDENKNYDRTGNFCLDLDFLLELNYTTCFK